MITPAAKESQPQQTLIQEGIRAETNSYPQVNITVNDQVLIADISATPEQMTRGLSVKDTLSENEAMLFVFDVEAEHRFWMKDMKFPIDIIWIHPNTTIVHIEKNLQPCISFLICPSYSPNDLSQYVLEVNAYYTTKHNITVGDKVEFNIVNSTGS